MIVLSEYPFHNLIHQLQPHTTLFIRTLGIQMSHLCQSASFNMAENTSNCVCVCDVCGMCGVCGMCDVCVYVCVFVCACVWCVVCVWVCVWCVCAWCVCGGVVWWVGERVKRTVRQQMQEEQPFTQKLSDSPSNSTSRNAQRQGEMLLPILSPIPFQMDGGWVMVWMFDRPLLNLLGEFFYYFLVRSFLGCMKCIAYSVLQLPSIL